MQRLLTLPTLLVLLALPVQRPLGAQNARRQTMRAFASDDSLLAYVRRIARAKKEAIAAHPDVFLGVRASCEPRTLAIDSSRSTGDVMITGTVFKSGDTMKTGVANVSVTVAPGGTRVSTDSAGRYAVRIPGAASPSE